jgi:hypothetical protein
MDRTGLEVGTVDSFVHNNETCGSIDCHYPKKNKMSITRNVQK